VVAQLGTGLGAGVARGDQCEVEEGPALQSGVGLEGLAGEKARSGITIRGEDTVVDEGPTKTSCET
jgi:hypothetical protein